MADAAVLATLGLILGLFFLGLEFFVPSFGMLLVLSVIALVVSFWSACKAWWGTDPVFFWSYVFLLIAGIPGSLMGAVAILQGTKLGRRMTLAPTDDTGPSPVNTLQSLIGQTGKSQTLMTPGGMVVVAGERFHAESTGMLVEPGTMVVVVGVRANRLVVRPQREDESAGAACGGASDAELPRGKSGDSGNDDAGRLDFDMPSDYTHGSARGKSDPR